MFKKIVFLALFAVLSVAAEAQYFTLSGTSVKYVNGSTTITQQANEFGYDYTSGNGYIYVRNNGRTLYKGLIADIDSINGQTTTNNKLTQLSNFVAAQPGTGRGNGSVASNIANSTTTAADATGLSFTATNGKRYKYKAYIIYNSAATTTGIALAVSGQTNTWSHITIPTTTAGANLQRAAYNVSTLFTATDAPATTNNVAIVEGFVNATTTGTVKIQFASEVGSSAVTVLAGSRIDWEEF